MFRCVPERVESRSQVQEVQVRVPDQAVGAVSAIVLLYAVPVRSPPL